MKSLFIHKHKGQNTSQTQCRKIKLTDNLFELYKNAREIKLILIQMSNEIKSINL